MSRKFSNRRSTYRIFVSHSWDYSDQYERFVEMLEDANHFEFDNYSAPEDDPVHGGTEARLRRELRKQIDPVSVVIVLAGMYANERKWIKEEIDIAENNEKPILGVEPWDSDRVPSTVKESANKMVGWNGSSVADGVRDLSP